MNTHRLPIAIAACLIGTSALSFSQEPVKAPVTRKAPQADEAGRGMAQRRLFLPHTEVLGHAVTATAGEATVEIGSVANLVLDSKDGSISHVVIEAGTKSAEPGKLRVVPFAQLAWTAGRGEDAVQAALSVDARAFDALPTFDPKLIDQLTGAKAVDAAAGRVDKATKDVADDEKAAAVKKAREAMQAPARSVLMSDLADLGVFAPTERKPFATVGELFLDCTRGQVAFAGVMVERTTYLVPFEILKLRSTPGADGADATLSMVAPTNAEGMVGAPAINVEDKQTASNPRFRASVYKHYGIKTPAPRDGKLREVDRKRDGATVRRAGGNG